MLGIKEKERELIFCQAKIESLDEQLKAVRAEKDELKEQVRRLQDALIAATAPEAYRDRKIEEAEAAREPLTPEEQEKIRIQKEFTKQYLNSLEKPTFTSGEDLDDMLLASLARNAKPPGSLHGNSES